MRVIGLTGMPGSGKTIAAQAARSLGLPVVRMGDCVWDEVQARGLPLTDTVVGGVAHEMRELHGPGIWAKRTLDRVKTLQAPRTVIDGVRSMAEVEVFRDALGRDFLLVAVHASTPRRHARLLNRRREDEANSEDEARARDRRELAWGIGEVIALADAMLVNEDRDEAEFLAEVRRVLGSA